MKRKFYSLCTVLLLFTPFVKSQTREMSTIQLVFNTGEKFELKNTLNTEIFRDEQLTTSQQYHFTLALNVIEKDTAGKTMIQARYIQISYRNEEKAKKEITGYNSAMPDSFINVSHNDKERSQNQMAKEFIAGMLNKPFTIYLDERTSRMEVTGIDTLVTQALNGIAVSDSQYLKGYRAGVQKVYNNVMMKERLVSAFSYITVKPVNLAAGWTKNVAVGGIVFRVRYTIESRQPDSIRLLAGPVTLFNFKKHIKTSRTGSLTIDAKTGLLIRSSMRNEIKPSPDSREFLNVLTEENELIGIK